MNNRRILKESNFWENLPTLSLTQYTINLFTKKQQPTISFEVRNFPCPNPVIDSFLLNFQDFRNIYDYSNLCELCTTSWLQFLFCLKKCSQIVALAESFGSIWVLSTYSGRTMMYKSVSVVTHLSYDTYRILKFFFWLLFQSTSCGESLGCTPVTVVYERTTSSAKARTSLLV